MVDLMGGGVSNRSQLTSTPRLDKINDQTRLSLMKTFNIQAAKTNLSRLIEDVLAGEEVIIAKAGKPLVALVPFQKTKSPRKLGTLKGLCREKPGCWDFDPEIIASFYQEDPFLKSRSST